MAWEQREGMLCFTGEWDGQGVGGGVWGLGGGVDWMGEAHLKVCEDGKMWRSQVVEGIVQWVYVNV